MHIRNGIRWLFEGRFWSAALRLAVPIALQNLLVCSFSLVDTIMVGQLGDIALSAVGMAGQWSWLMNMVLFGVASGASVYFAQYWGNRDERGIRRILGLVLLSGIVFSLMFALIAYLAPVSVIRIFNRTDAVVEVGSAYLRIAAFSYVAIALNTILCTALRSTERVRLPLLVSGISTVLNAVLNYGLIFGKLGLPEMGVAGAALATCISSWTAPILLVVICVLKRCSLFSVPRELISFGFRDIIEFYKKAVPVILNESLWGLGTVLFNIIYSNLGYEHYAAVTILRTFENIAFTFFIGLCNASCVMVGKAVGSGEIEKGVSDARRFAVIVPMLSVLVGAAIILARSSLIQIFNLGGTITETTVSSANWIMLIYGCELAFRNIPYIIIVGIFRPGGDTAVGMKYDMLTLWGFSLPATFIAAFLLKLPFPVCFAVSYIFEDYIKVILCIRHMKSMKWLKPVTAEGHAGLAKWIETQKARVTDHAI